MRVLFFGCHGSKGHYLWTEDRRRHLTARPGEEYGYVGSQGEGTWIPMGWKKLDGAFPPRPGKQGEASLHHVGDWTVIAWWDYSVDDRGGSNANFLIEQPNLDFDTALALARDRWPEVFARFSYKITEAPR